jgi:hypothetical protein
MWFIDWGSNVGPLIRPYLQHLKILQNNVGPDTFRKQCSDLIKLRDCSQSFIAELIWGTWKRSVVKFFILIEYLISDCLVLIISFKMLRDPRSYETAKLSLRLGGALGNAEELT